MFIFLCLLQLYIILFIDTVYIVIIEDK